METIKRIKEKRNDEVGPERRYRWWHAAAIGVTANVASGVSVGRREQDRRYYEELEQTFFAPPSWAFAPAWLVNNASTLWGNLRLLNSADRGTAFRPALLVLQGTSWLLFATFNHVYFRRRSPVLGFVWTAADWLLTVVSVVLSLGSGRRDIALSLATKLAWLTPATPVTAYQAARNPDKLLGRGKADRRLHT